MGQEAVQSLSPPRPAYDPAVAEGQAGERGPILFPLRQDLQAGHPQLLIRVHPPKADFETVQAGSTANLIHGDPHFKQTLIFPISIMCSFLRVVCSACDYLMESRYYANQRTRMVEQMLISSL